MNPENHNFGTPINENEQAPLNYSPDTSLLLSLGNEDKITHTQTPLPTSKKPNQQTLLGQTPTIFTCEDPWQTGQLQGSVAYGYQPQVNIFPLPDNVYLPPNLFLNQNFPQLSVTPTVDSIGNISYLNNQTLVRTGFEDCPPGTVPVMPINFCQNPNQISVPSQNFNVGTSIYVNKGVFRLSEAEDWTPNPVRLLDILSELEKLNEVICKLKDECDLPNAKPNIKRERNRLASKACRLKKKATHETNKIKLEELLVYALHYMSWEFISNISFQHSGTENLSSRLREIQSKYLTCVKVAGDSDNFVKTVLERTREAEQAAVYNLHTHGVPV